MIKLNPKSQLLWYNMIEGVETMGQNLTCYMNIKILLIVLASAILAKIGLDALGYTGFFLNTIVFIVDNAILIYLVVSIMIDTYGIGRLNIKCILFDLLIAFLMLMAYWIGIVIVAYVFVMINGFFKYMVF